MLPRFVVTILRGYTSVSLGVNVLRLPAPVDPDRERGPGDVLHRFHQAEEEVPGLFSRLDRRKANSAVPHLGGRTRTYVTYLKRT